jgi:type IX secretion system substrate protein
LRYHFLANSKIIIFSVLFLIPIYTVNLFAQTNLSQGLQMIDEDESNGILTHEEALVQKFYYGFNKSALDRKYYIVNDLPGKCGTQIMMDYHQNKNTFSESSVAKIENCLGTFRKKSILESKYISPDGKFELSYTTIGDNAVSAEDIDSSGVPDYVERIASYFDYSWKFAIDTLGILAPPIGEGKYQISFENSGYYGYTEIVEGKLTRISMSDSYGWAPPNDDPEGYEIGAAKVTAIHEFKHATQIVYNNWEVPAWFLEVDATWFEDIGYDYVNDYYTYLKWGPSHIVLPQHSFIGGDGYSDCIFMHYLSEKYGIDINRKLWERMKQYPDEELNISLGVILYGYGTSIEESLPEYFSWCYLTGDNADSRFPSFEEATYYPTSKLTETVSTLPHNITSSAREALAAEYLRFTDFTSKGDLGLEFESESSENTLVLIAYFKDSTADLNYYSDIGNISIDVERKLEEISSFVLIPVITNVEKGFQYSLGVGAYQDAIYKHTPLVNTEGVSTKNVIVSVMSKSGNIDYDSLKLYYKTGTSEFESVFLQETGNVLEYSAEIRDIADGDTISYYFSIYDLKRNYYNNWPLNAPNTFFSFVCGVDNTPPIVLHKDINSLTKYDFPRRIFAQISDNYGFTFNYVEYKINDEAVNNLNLVQLNDSIYYAELFADTSLYNVNDKISYRIIATDSSANNNKTFYPDSGYVTLNINEGYKYIVELSDTSSSFLYSDTLIIEEDIEISDLNVVFEASNTSISNIEAFFISPEGEFIEIISFSSVSGKYASSDSISIVFDDEADLEFSNFIATDKDYVTGHYKSNKLQLNKLNGKSTKGEWILVVYNLNSSEKEMFLKKWGLIIQSSNIVNVEKENNIVAEFKLEQNYPNPFNPTTNIKYSVPKTSNVKLRIYNIMGQLVKTLVNENKVPGLYNIEWNGTNENNSRVASGVYFSRFESDNFTAYKKMILLK